MINITDYMVSSETIIVEAMKKIDKGARGIVFVCENARLKGTVTDGDIRRHILRGGSLNCAVEEIADGSPVFLYAEESDMAENVMKNKSITAIPVVDGTMKIIDIKFWQGERTTIPPKELNVPLVIMAGGRGMRLRPYTDILPKPLIPMGDETITERIMDRFAVYGCRDVYMIVNYKKNFIKAYFSDRADNALHMSFIEEDEFRGTGGGLRLLENRIESTFFMSNCDVLIEADYEDIMKYHQENKNIITMVCVKKKFEIPYGAVKVNRDNQVEELEEKPKFEYNVNTGLYVIEPEFVRRIPLNTFVHITEVISSCIEDGQKVGSYIVPEEAWIDIGQFDEYEKMRGKFDL